MNQDKNSHTGSHQPLGDLVAPVVDALISGEMPAVVVEIDAAVRERQLAAITLAANTALENMVAHDPHSLAALRGLVAQKDEITQQSLMATDKERAAFAEHIHAIDTKIKALIEENNM